ncbi:hypothetical protein AB4865_07720 [Capnocytophaga sp. ARDL2]|uniref:hypothetical protein n=1 Tax=Capnocytophaga sp. ARDL2 TaxID=3238809 RepID=UPI00355627A4
MKLTIQILSAKATMLAEFSRGKLKKITLQKGKFTAEQWLKIGAILPPTENDIEAFKQRLNGVIYEVLESSPQPSPKAREHYQRYVTLWFDFYERFTGLKPRFNAVEGKHLKEIIKYLQEICQSDEEALNMWQVLLENWQKLDAFHQKNTDLKYINSNLNKIIQNAKQLTTNGTKSKYSNDFKRQIFEALRS